MRTAKDLCQTAPTIYLCELETCPQCQQPLSEAHYVNGRKTVQTMTQVLSIGYRPKVCVNAECPGPSVTWPSATRQQLAPKGCTYGYDVIARIGWERQKGRERFEAIQTHLEPWVAISEHMRCSAPVACPKSVSPQVLAVGGLS